MESLKFLVKENRIWVYGYVIMPNHVHILWRKQDEWINKSPQQQFLKFTAQKIKFNLLEHFPDQLESYRSTQADRVYHFWERRPYKATMFDRTVCEQKLDYMHNNPVKLRSVYCRKSIYTHPRITIALKKSDLITHYMDHI